MRHLTASDLRQNVADTLNRVAYGGERVVLRRNKKDLAALVSLADLALLEEIENRMDAEAYRKAKAEFEKSGYKSIPFEKLCREMGL